MVASAVSGLTPDMIQRSFRVCGLAEKGGEVAQDVLNEELQKALNPVNPLLFGDLEDSDDDDEIFEGVIDCAENDDVDHKHDDDADEDDDDDDYVQDNQYESGRHVEANRFNIQDPAQLEHHFGGDANRFVGQVSESQSSLSDHPRLHGEIEQFESRAALCDDDSLTDVSEQNDSDYSISKIFDYLD
jgi:hypothetical protein